MSRSLSPTRGHSPPLTRISFSGGHLASSTRGQPNKKKEADKGIDGRLYFHEGDTSQTKQIVISVKAGKLHAPYVRDLRGVMEREQAEMSVLLSLEEPTAKMRTEAASSGFYASAWRKHPRLQIVTVGELLDGQKLDAPPPRQTSVTFKRAPRAKTKTAKNLDLDLGKD